MSEFKITGKKGFHITFENGWTISVQFGPGNYCDNYDMRIGGEEERAGSMGSGTAEVAAWGRGGKMIEWPNGDTVTNRSTANEVAQMIARISAMEPI